MLCALRKTTNQIVFARTEPESNGPFLCPECSEVVVLRRSPVKLPHFAHTPSGICQYSAPESEEHRECKVEIARELVKEANVRNVAMERSFGSVRPDVYAEIRGVPVGIEVQISNLSLETIIHRTKEYERKGIYVLWLPQWREALDSPPYSPTLWEKWIHAAYFGCVFYWVSGLSVVSYRFEPHYRHVPRTTWYSANGKKVSAGGYVLRAKQKRTPVRGKSLNVVRDFVPQQRQWWRGGGLEVPFARLFLTLSG